MRVVIDTNVFLVAIARQSKIHPIYTALLNQRYDLLVSAEIIFEYTEVLWQRSRPNNVRNALRALQALPNVLVAEPSYRWRLIPHDPDDDKFVDCAVAGDADFLVTDDGHFDRLKDVEFPRLEVISGERFLALFTEA